MEAAGEALKRKSGVAVTVLNTRGVYTEANSAARIILSEPPIGHHISAVVEGPLLNEALRELADIVATGRPKINKLLPYYSPLDKMLKRWSRTDKYPILDASGAVAAVALYSFDVTDRMDQSYAVSDLRLHLTGAQEMRELLDLLQGASSYPLVDKALYRVRSHATNYEKMLAPLVARFAPSAKSKEFFLAPETIIVVVGGFADESNMLPRSPLISLAMHPEMYIVTSGDESFYALTLMHALDAASLCTPPIIEVHVHSDGRTEIFEVLVTFSSSADPQTTPHLALHLNAAKHLASRNYCTFDWRKESDKWTLTLLASLAPLEVQDELSVLPDTKNVLKRSRYDSY